MLSTRYQYQLVGKNTLLKSIGVYYMLKIDRFIDKKLVRNDCFIVIFFIILFIASSLFGNNLFLKDNGLGLFEHINIWIFLLANFLVPLILYNNYKILADNVSEDIVNDFRTIFNQKVEKKLIKVLFLLTSTVGFCFFVGNSLQNAHIINILPFCYWDSIDYLISYIISRIYKLYLFVYFMPVTFFYSLLSIKSASEILKITNEEMSEYPIKNYVQLNALCCFGLNTSLAIVIPVFLFSGGIYLVHERWDITTLSTIILVCIIVLILLVLYILLINKYYISVIRYKDKHIIQILTELAKIHNNVLTIEISEQNNEKLDFYLKKEEYLWKCKERVQKISKYPLVIKAGITIISPLIPTFIKIAFSIFEYFF